MNYFRIIESNEVIFSNSGSPVKRTYRGRVVKDGSIELVETGVINTDDQIESYRQGTELATLISRYENGDLLALNSRSGFYGDVTNFPASLGEAMDIVLNAQSEFDKLPLDKKKAFDGDWHKWLASFGSTEWIQSMGLDPKEDVKEKESDFDASEK